MGRLWGLLLVLVATASGLCQYSDENKVLVVVATRDIRPYSRVIDEYMVKRVKYPEHLLPRYAPLDVKDVLGQVATEFIAKDEIVSLQRLMDADEYADSLAREVPPSWLYTTLPIALSKEIGAVKLEGQVVDIVALYKDKKGWVSRLVASDARLIKIGKLLDAATKRAFFFTLRKEDADMIGFLRTLPQTEFHLLFKDRWHSQKTVVAPITEGEL